MSTRALIGAGLDRATIDEIAQLQAVATGIHAWLDGFGQRRPVYSHHFPTPHDEGGLRDV